MTRMNKNQVRSLQPVLPLTTEALESPDKDKTKFISMELKARVGAPASSPSYKKYVRKFEEGTPQEWIDLRRDILEIWTQNGITGATDRTSTIRALLRGESLTTFETALADARQDAEGAETALSAEMVEIAMDNVTKSVFPHRALEIQKLWMQRGMKKPFDLSTRKTAAAITRINNALPMFPGGSETSKFSNQDLVGLLEWALPQPWRTKFDLDGYVPTLHPKAKLIEACEAIERNEVPMESDHKTNDKGKSKNAKSAKNGWKAKNSENNSTKKLYCSEHGQNATHSTKDCFTIKNREKKGNYDKSKDSTNRKFSSRNFQKELHMLSQDSSKSSLLDAYAGAIARAQAKNKLVKSPKRKSPAIDIDSDSDTDLSNHMVEDAAPVRKKVRKTPKPVGNDPSEKTEEEKAFLKKVNLLELSNTDTSISATDSE